MMSLLVRRFAHLARLLAVFWTITRSGAIDDTDSRLIAIETKLNALVFKQDRSDVRLDQLISRVGSMQNTPYDRLNEPTTTKDSPDARLDEMTSPVDSMQDTPENRLDELTARVNSTKNGPDTRLDELTSRVDSMQDTLGNRLDELTARMNWTADQRAKSVSALPLRDCNELSDDARTGVHLLQPDRFQPPVAAFCDLDQDGGCWTVIKRRDDVRPRQDFFLGWAEYKQGFGDLEAEFWWGLEKLWLLTSSRDHQYELRVNVVNFYPSVQRHAVYGQFRVASEADGYRLSVTNYTGDAGDSLGDHNRQKFSTKDNDNDTNETVHCARVYQIGGWYGNCKCIFIPTNDHSSSPFRYGNEPAYWVSWFHGVVKEVEMKVRPVKSS